MDDSPLSQQVHSQQSPPSNPQAWVLYSSSHRPSPMRATYTISQSKSLSRAADTPAHNTAHNSRTICHKENRAMVWLIFCDNANVHPAEGPEVGFRVSTGNRRARSVRTQKNGKIHKTKNSFVRWRALLTLETVAKMVPHSFQVRSFSTKQWCSFLGHNIADTTK